MDFTEFIMRGLVFLTFAIAIYAYAQKFLADRKTEKGFHWRGMVLKYASWPIFLYAFYLTLRNKKIPYLPTSKTAIKKFMNPFVKPLIAYNIIFIITVIGVYIQRRFFTPESELIFSVEKTWGMIAFSFVAFVQSFGGILAAYQSKFIKEEDAWDRIEISKNKKIELK